MGETVYVKANPSGGRDVYHTDPDCGINGTLVPKPRAQFTNLTLCKHCAGETDRPDEMDWTAYHTLRDADPDDLVTDGGVDLLEACDEVYVLAGQGGNGTGPRRFHSNEECRAVQQSPRDTRPILSDRVPERWRPCKFCAGTAAPYSKQGNGHYEALVAAAEADTDLVPDGGER